jgi:hypothetical protein
MFGLLLLAFSKGDADETLDIFVDAIESAFGNG